MKITPECFDGIYAANRDPGHVRDRWYEARKRGLVLASLPRHHYINALDIGCGVDALTEQIATRCDRVTALDASASANALVRDSLTDQRNVVTLHASIRADWPNGRFDLIVLSEAGYYLDRSELATLAGCISQSLAPDGTLVTCHWRHPVDGAEFSAGSIHAALARRAGLTRLSRVDDEDFLLDVFEQDSQSVAAREGIV